MFRRSLLVSLVMLSPALAVAGPVTFSFADDPADWPWIGRTFVAGPVTGILYGLADNGTGQIPTSIEFTSDVTPLGMTSSVVTSFTAVNGTGFTVVNGNVVAADLLLNFDDPSVDGMQVRFNHEARNVLHWNGGSGPVVGMGNENGFAGATYGATVQYELAFNPAGVGQILYVPYFSTQEGNVTAMSIVNTDTVNGKVLKVRFRGASNSDDVYDFQVFLSPGDVWTAGISKGADGRSQLATTDKSCTLPASVNGSFITGRLPAAGGADETREGYIEILTMADIVKGADKSNQLALYTATKHVKGSAPCTASVTTALTHENASDYMAAPTTGIMANWTIINVAKVVAYSGDAAAIEARDADGMPIAGNLVYWDQRSTPLTEGEIATGTADPLIRDGAIVGARYDLPDLSTPYLPGNTCPFCQARALSDAIAVQEVAGEFYSEASVGAQTDWVISFPTRRYFAAVDYADENTPVYSEAGNIYFNEDSTEMGNAANGGKAWQLCSVFGANALAFYDREEIPTVVDDIVISPGTPSKLSICGEVTVLGINAGASTATFGSVARANVSNGFKEGWGSLATPGTDGLPMLVRQFTRVNNTQTNVYYGLSYPARIVTRGTPAPFVPDN